MWAQSGRRLGVFQFRAATSVNDFAVGTTFRSISLGASATHLSGNAVTLTAGIVSNNGDFSHIGMNLTLGASQTFSNIAGVGYFIDGSIDLNGKTLTFDIGGSNGGGLIPPSPVVVSVTGVIQGNGAIVKDGIQQLIFAGNNTFTGPVDVRAGTLSLNNNNAAGASGGQCDDRRRRRGIGFEWWEFHHSRNDQLCQFDSAKSKSMGVRFYHSDYLDGSDHVERSQPLARRRSRHCEWFARHRLTQRAGRLTFTAGSTSTYTGTLNGESQPLTFNGTGPNRRSRTAAPRAPSGH